MDFLEFFVVKEQICYEYRCFSSKFPSLRSSVTDISCDCWHVEIMVSVWIFTVHQNSLSIVWNRLHWKRFSCRIHSTSVRIFIIVFRGACSLRRFVGLHHAKRIWIFETPIIARQTQPGHKTSPRVKISSDYVVRLDVKEARHMRRRILLEEESEERGANAASTLQHKHSQRQQLQALLLTERVMNRVKEGEILLKNQVQEQWTLLWWGELFNSVRLTYSWARPRSNIVHDIWPSC